MSDTQAKAKEIHEREKQRQGQRKSAQAHTPGPWTVCAHWMEKKCACGRHRGYVFSADKKSVVAQMGCCPDADGKGNYFPIDIEASHEQMRADAHLIAAAPQMLGALLLAALELQFVLEGTIKQDEVKKTQKVVLDAIRATKQTEI